MAIFLNDTFTGTDGDSLATVHVGEVGGAWSITSLGGCVLFSNRLRGSSSTFSVWRSSAPPSSADYSVTTVIRNLTAPGGLWGPTGRGTHSGDYFYAAFYSGWLGGWALYKRINGSLIQLGSTVAIVLTPGADYTLTLDMVGTTIRLLVGGVETISATDSAITAAGIPGIAIEEGAAGTTTGKHVASIIAERVDTAAPSYGTHCAFVVDGDSISGDIGRLGTATLSMLLAASTRWNSSTHWNYSVGGQTCVQALADAATQIDTLYAMTAGYTLRLCVVLIGVNDVITADTAATINANIRSYHSGRKAAGFKTVGMTIMKAGSVNGANETKRAAVNAALIADTSFCDYFVDSAAISQFSNTADTTYFTDGVHLTVVGAGILGDAIVAAVPTAAGLTDLTTGVNNELLALRDTQYAAHATQPLDSTTIFTAELKRVRDLNTTAANQDSNTKLANTWNGIR